MSLQKKTKLYIGKSLNLLPPRLSGQIKCWCHFNLNPIDQLALARIDKLIPNSVSNNTEVLFWRGVPGRKAINFEATIALALQLRGVNCRFVICDGIMSGCIQRTIADGKPINKWKSRCHNCVRQGIHILNIYGVPYVKMSELVSSQQQAKLRKSCDYFSMIDRILWQFAEASSMRYLKGQQIEGNEDIFREYLYSAMICREAANQFLKQYKPNRVFMQRHIEYVEWAPAYVVLTEAGLPTTLFAGSLALDGCVTLKSTLGTDWNCLSSVTVKTWEQISKCPLTEEEDKALDLVLNKPWRVGSTNSFNHSNAPKELLLKELNIADEKPIWCVFTHVTWDAGFNLKNTVFKDVFEWTVIVVQAMLETKDVTWLLKIHPGELLGTSYGIEEFIKDRFPKVSQHICFISSNSKITINDLYPILSGGITKHGTVGLQLPAHKIPVIVGEQAHYTDKGFTYNGFTQERYIELVHQAGSIPPLSIHQQNLARRYAHLLYLKRRIRIPTTQELDGYSPLDPKKIHLLFPGNNSTMDMICDRTMNGGEFTL